MHSYPVGAFHPIEDTSVNHSIGEHPISRSSSFKQPIKTWGISFLRYALSFGSSRIGSLVSNSMNEGVFADESGETLGEDHATIEKGKPTSEAI